MKSGAMALTYQPIDPTDQPSAVIHPSENPRCQAETELQNNQLAREYQGLPKPQQPIQGGLEAPKELE